MILVAVFVTSRALNTSAEGPVAYVIARVSPAPAPESSRLTVAKLLGHERPEDSSEVQRFVVPTFRRNAGMGASVFIQGPGAQSKFGSGPDFATVSRC